MQELINGIHKACPSITWFRAEVFAENAQNAAIFAKENVHICDIPGQGMILMKESLLSEELKEYSIGFATPEHKIF